MNLTHSQKILTTIPFAVEELHFEGASHPYTRILSPDWVIVLPILKTESLQAVMIRQFRAGALSSILELPGGCIDPEEQRDPTLAARRELEEETGFRSDRILPLASINPNPALQNNKAHFFLALDCYVPSSRIHFPDREEQIKVELVPVTELDPLIRLNRIDHSLSALCILLSMKYLS